MYRSLPDPSYQEVDVGSLSISYRTFFRFLYLAAYLVKNSSALAASSLGL